MENKRKSDPIKNINRDNRDTYNKRKCYTE